MAFIYIYILRTLLKVSFVQHYNFCDKGENSLRSLIQKVENIFLIYLIVYKKKTEQFAEPLRRNIIEFTFILYYDLSLIF